MCVVGCSPKKGLYEYRDKGGSDFKATEYIFKGDEIRSTQGLKEFIRDKIQEINFFTNSHLYQGCLIQAKGKSPEPAYWEEKLDLISSAIYMGRDDVCIGDSPASLRPAHSNQIVQSPVEDVTVDVSFIFSPNRSIKSYLYSREDGVHIICPKLSLKYLKQNRDLKHDESREGVRILYVELSDQIDENFRRLIEKHQGPLCILCNNDNVYHRLLEFMEHTGKEWAAQDSWV